MNKFISSIAGLLIFTGLPLAGWGLTDLHGFLQNPARLTFLVSMAVLSLLVELIIPESGRSRNSMKNGMHTGPGPSRLFLIFISGTRCIQLSRTGQSSCRT
jgi:hypothetical protein